MRLRLPRLTPLFAHGTQRRLPSEPVTDIVAERLVDAAAQPDTSAEWTELRQIVREDSPLIFVHYETINYLMSTDVVGSTVTPTLELNMKNVGFQK